MPKDWPLTTEVQPRGFLHRWTEGVVASLYTPEMTTRLKIPMPLRSISTTWASATLEVVSKRGAERTRQRAGVRVASARARERAESSTVDAGFGARLEVGKAGDTVDREDHISGHEPSRLRVARARG